MRHTWESKLDEYYDTCARCSARSRLFTVHQRGGGSVREYVRYAQVLDPPTDDPEMIILVKSAPPCIGALKWRFAGPPDLPDPFVPSGALL